MITSNLTEFIVSTDYGQLPENVKEKTKLCFADFLGVALRGSETKSGSAVKNLIKAGDESTVLGQGKASVPDAGLANGIFAHSLDLDDGHRHAQLHPGACVIPAALSLCEAGNKSGKEFITSMVVGYQIAIIIGIMVNPEHRNRGFHSTGTCGTLGAAAAAASALKLNEEQTINTMGLAGTQAAGLLESDHSGSMGKHLHTGKAAQSGVLSALLAKQGFSGSETILEGDEGFLKAMAGICAQDKFSNLEKFSDINLFSNLNMEKFRILDVYFKIYPVCRHLHSSIDALLDIIHDNNLKFGEIEEIIVKTYKIAADHDDYHPSTLEAVRQSLPFSLAIAVLSGRRWENQPKLNEPGMSYHLNPNEPGLNNFLELDNSMMNDPILMKKITNISQKIVIEHDNDFDNIYPDKRPSEVVVKVKNVFYEKRVDLPRGERENPLKKSELIEKFHNLNPDVNGEIFQIIDKIESYNDMNDFMDVINSYLI